MRKKKLTPEERQQRRRRIYRKRSGKIYLRITCIFLLFMIVAIGFNIFMPDKEYSESENRMLAQAPEFSIGNLASGKYMTDMEDYVTDQFFFRDQWINLKLLEDMALGKRESNGVYIGKKGYLMQIPENNIDMESVEDNLKGIREFAQRHEEVNTVMSLVPNAAYILEQLTPANAPVRDQSQDIALAEDAVGDVLTYVDLTDTMASHRDEEIYYKTDHHWTSLGARYAFDTLYSALGILEPATDYTIYPVSHSFSGTLASKSGYDRSRDTIELYVPQEVDTECVVNYVEEGVKTASMYESSALDQKDQYEVFFGGNHSRIDITTAVEENRNLLIFKDSYANCFIPLLQPYFRSIIVIDPRYYYDDVDRLVTDNSITDILFLYNVDTFMTDTSLADALEPVPGSEVSPADISGTGDTGTEDSSVQEADDEEVNGTGSLEDSDEDQSGSSLEDSDEDQGGSSLEDSDEDQGGSSLEDSDEDQSGSSLEDSDEDQDGSSLENSDEDQSGSSLEDSDEDQGSSSLEDSDEDQGGSSLRDSDEDQADSNSRI